MKKLLLPLLALIIGIGIGVAGSKFLLPGHGLKPGTTPTATAPAFNPKQAVAIQFDSVQSNLADSGHYINFSLSFSVMPTVLTAQGGVASAAAGSGGTGNAALDARIRNALLNLARSTSYQQLLSSGGVSTFKREVSLVLQSIFGPGTVHDIYFSQFLVQ
ncbi:MAG: flagellar basal body-associated FliL family protein [Firmicutes bacterium]|nr:flagellar basal body-associated FliL family protein [Alicyclobacillaceae bacterium]MCL6497314.1 flagellar basal body-associated FliL family protein [Bacillota bacterium]